ncbi:hypothetical protein BDW74DRAFT_144307 [Aspergillus multicolor]|uniref:uncharacterized protein n=1 Tax=Aspergillus multicolor TaxID=41759 RepID=UPI003CCE2295
MDGYDNMILSLPTHQLSANNGFLERATATTGEPWKGRKHGIRSVSLLANGLSFAFSEMKYVPSIIRLPALPQERGPRSPGQIIRDYRKSY